MSIEEKISKQKKFIITNHSELRRRVSLDCSKPVLTDQSQKAMTDINNIMLAYSKTGLLPSQTQKLAYYIDNTEIPSLEEAHKLISDAKNMFYELPAQVRKLMDNDPTKLVSFINDEENKDILIKYGILEPKQDLNKPEKTAEKLASQGNPSGDDKVEK
jgi:hypothetical protein